MCRLDKMSAGMQRDDNQQYCAPDDGKSLSNTNFVQYSSTETPDWCWDEIKPEVGSSKDWNSDSESSQQTILYGGSRDSNAENTPSTDCSFNLSSTTEEISGRKKKKGKDTPAVNKPAQVVERRNARERRRVQAVNGAFQKLRRVVPIEENKSKRMSKVKTLQLAIEYINQLQNQLRPGRLIAQRQNHIATESMIVDLFSDFQQQELVKLEPNEFSYRMPTTYYINENEN